ncbi:hypothetical protein IC582_002755 [Cucumis melo]
MYGDITPFNSLEDKFLELDQSCNSNHSMDIHLANMGLLPNF